jgi:UDP-glucose:(heptosyl)LPS alpha-1,3-glucosyltransferase
VSNRAGCSDCEASHAAREETANFRIAFAIQRYFDFGGLQRDMRRVASACAESGHEVHILTSEWDGPSPKNLHVQRLPLFARTNHGRSRRFAELVGEYVRHNRFDCLVGFHRMPGLDVYWAGDPCVAESLQSKFRGLRFLPRYQAYLSLETAVMGRENDAELLILSETEKERIARHYGPPESRMHLLPPGIDRRRFEGADDPSMKSVIRDEFGVGGHELMLLMVGSSYRTKGVDRALRAVSSLDERLRLRTRLVVVGNGTPAPFERLARRLGISDRVRFAGGRDDVAKFYRAADLLLHPARTETAGHTLLEAMICGLPVLVTENCGYAVHVRRASAGLICPHPFVQRDLNRLLPQTHSASARQQWKKNALAYCQAADLYSMVDRTVEIIVARAARNRAAASNRQARGDRRAA